MYERAKNYTLTRPRLRKTVGWFLVIIGIFALVVPLIPGIVLIAIGIEILGLRLLFRERFMKHRAVPVRIEE